MTTGVHVHSGDPEEPSGEHRHSGEPKQSERRGYIVLVLISLLLSVLSYAGGVHRADQDGKKFCDIINTSIAVPVVKPANPKKDPSREARYQYYLKFKALDERLGC
jgi:hypothetical protein